MVIEDNKSISNLICMNLSVVGYDAHPCLDGLDAMTMLQGTDEFDLAIVDVMLPGIDGFDLLPILNERGIPAIFLTARNDIESKVRGLKGGAEDYIVKPFEILELLVRIEKVLERRGHLQNLLVLGHIDVYVQERIVKLEGQPVYLKPQEFDLLVALAKNKNIAMSREKLLAQAWGIDFMGETRTVDVHIAQLRRKTGLAITAVPKIGYRLESES
jgi:DNA-binding response OmpR family regulator